MENECELLSSRGVLKSCCLRSRDPTGDLTRPVTYVIDKANAAARRTPSVYVNTGSLDFFCRKILPSVRSPVVLVTGDSDVPLPNPSFCAGAVRTLLSHPMIKRWYCQNLCMDLPGLHALPIGLDYHTVSKGGHWGEDARSPREQELSLLEASEAAVPFWERERKCYVNFQYGLHHSTGEPVTHAGTRKAACTVVDRSLCYFEVGATPRSTCWRNQSQHAFVISPPGNGLDCHRTWEALNLGCIPIVIRMAGWRLDVFDGLPVLVVDSWEDITQDLLDSTVERFRETTFNYDKLRLEHWVEEIHR